LGDSYPLQRMAILRGSLGLFMADDSGTHTAV
jgi:hypothetical protein